MHKVFVTDHNFPSIERERRVLLAAGAELAVSSPFQGDSLPDELRSADALLVQWARITAPMLAAMPRCRVIVRYGIGVDNIDLAAARAHGIAVCNVPDYGIDEVADHAIALALALGRQLPALDRRLRTQSWKMAPCAPMPAFREMVFATAGFGRIARAVLERARGLRFKLAAYDPFVPAGAFELAGVRRLSPDELFREADVLSLHLPLTDQTRHFIRAETLGLMKPTAILVNTARGPLVHATDLVAALKADTIAAAGLDVFDPEPPARDDPLFAAPRVLLTPHVAWYSEQSGPTLQQLAAEEIVRGLRGEPLRNRVN